MINRSHKSKYCDLKPIPPVVSIKKGDLVTVTDDRLNSGKAIGVIAHIHSSKWGPGISIYHVFSQGKEIKVLRSQIWDVNEER